MGANDTKSVTPCYSILSPSFPKLVTRNPEPWSPLYLFTREKRCARPARTSPKSGIEVKEVIIYRKPALEGAKLENVFKTDCFVKTLIVDINSDGDGFSMVIDSQMCYFPHGLTLLSLI